MGKRFYITTAIDYTNSTPHIGHAFEKIQADAIARYHRLLGDDVYFLTGTDENSLNCVRAAEREGIDVSQLVDRNAQIFRELKPLLNLSYDDFIRTTEPRHFAGAQKLWLACRPGDIYKKPYRGLYCVGCETFYDEEELSDGLCPNHKTKPDLVEEENYFFRLSAYQERLKSLIESDALRVVPTRRKNEILSFIEMGLKDFSISRSYKRSRGWGVPVPGDGSQVMYVWFDALANYITALDYAGSGELFRRYWQDDGTYILHVIGKDITRFHAIYWPAMLMSAGLRLPQTIFVHGFITVGGEKMSKTLGNIIDPFELVRRYGADATRYYLLREIPSTEDGDFTFEKFQARYTADLANNLGNLVNRSISMVLRYRDGLLRRALNGNRGQMLRGLAEQVYKEYNAAMEAFELHNAMAAVWRLISAANIYIQEGKPWDLYKDTSRQGELDAILYQICEALRIAAILLFPMLPATAGKIWDQLGMAEPLEKQSIAKAGTWGLIPEGTKVQKGGLLFPRLAA